MKKRGIFALLLAAAMTVSMTACSGGSNTSSAPASSTPASSGSASSSSAASGEPINLRMIWWGSQTRHEYTQAAIKVFESKNPGVTISPEYVAWDGYWQKLATMSASKDLPDIIQQDYKYIVQYAKNNLIIDMKPYVDKGTLNLTDCPEANWKSGVIEDKLVALCIGVNSICTLFNEDMLTKIGEKVPPLTWTYDDYEKLCAKATEHKAELGIDYADDSTQGNCQEQIAYSFRENDKWFYNQDGSEGFGWDKDAGKSIIAEYLNREKSFVDKGYSSPLAVRDERQTNGVESTALVKDKSLMVSGVWSNQAKAITTAAGKNFAITSYPSKTEKRMQYIKPSQFFSVATNSKNPDMAIKFIDGITNDVDMNMELKAERGVPISTKVQEALAATYEEGSVDKAIFDYIAEIAPIANQIWVPEPKASGAIITLEQNMLKDVVNNGMTAEAAFDKFYEQATIEFEMAK